MKNGDRKFRKTFTVREVLSERRKSQPKLEEKLEGPGKQGKLLSNVRRKIRSTQNRGSHLPSTEVPVLTPKEKEE